MNYQVYNSFLYGSMIVIIALVVLSVIRRIAEGKRITAKCHELVENKCYVTGRLIQNKNTSLGKRIKNDDDYVHYITYAYTVNGTEYKIKRRYKTENRRREFPSDPSIYYEPNNPAKCYIEGEADVYTAGNAVMTFIRTAFLLGLYWVFFVVFLPGIPALDKWFNG